MELIQREIEATRDEIQDDMTASLANGERLCLRWANPENPSRDLLLNLTVAETKKIQRSLK